MIHVALEDSSYALFIEFYILIWRAHQKMRLLMRTSVERLCYKCSQHIEKQLILSVPYTTSAHLIEPYLKPADNQFPHSLPVATFESTRVGVPIWVRELKVQSRHQLLSQSCPIRRNISAPDDRLVQMAAWGALIVSISKLFPQFRSFAGASAGHDLPINIWVGVWVW